MIYFEDIEPGSKSAFGRYEVTREEVIEFASKYDPQPFHLDDEAAAKTHFSKIAASGWHTCAMAMRMIVGNMESNRQAGLGGAGVDELRWFRPVFPDDVLRCESEILDKTPSKSRPEMGSYRGRTTVFNQDDDAVLSFISIGLIRKRPQKE
ncbi:MaoC family dehydratase [Parasphingopyxis algicola]|uniref:MaoC family dehydratase n=1 Tax=Parasphingopyxis algicola TaxID=2026624 RepID=UPI0015A48A18|nr:MaoC family dehydratase [Parasphingopyxis algicola]QLC24522.1 MaoC family dehydratase [Parasphingopyxis algicola]